jgi:hypothetical protein
MRTTVIRTQVVRALREAAARHSEKLMKIAVSIASDESIDPNARLKAIAMIWDRAAGKPTQELILEDDDNGALLERMQKAIEHTKNLMQPALPPPSPTAEVIDLRPTKDDKHTYEVVPLRRRNKAIPGN